MTYLFNVYMHVYLLSLNQLFFKFLNMDSGSIVFAIISKLKYLSAITLNMALFMHL